MTRLPRLALLLIAAALGAVATVPVRAQGTDARAEVSSGRLQPLASPGGLALVGLAGLPAEAPPADATGLAVVPDASAQRVLNAAVEAAPMYYAVRRGVEVLTGPGTGGRVATLDLRDGARLLDGADREWALVWTEAGRGYVRTADLSNLWILIDKSDRAAYVYRGAELADEIPIDVSASDGDKVRRSSLNDPTHWRIPEGVFFVTNKNDRSQYYKAFVLNYPNAEHGARGLRDGIITEAQYQAIAVAERESRRPPMNTGLGGLIEIHGQGTGRGRAWTRGCVALRNVHMDDLWDVVQVGTPVVIED